jgi:hypothetical protein
MNIFEHEHDEWWIPPDPEFEYNGRVVLLSCRLNLSEITIPDRFLWAILN